MLLGKAVSNSREGTRLSFLVPLLGPGIGADRVGVLPQGRTLSFISGLLCAQEPFVVTIPAVEGLVLGREALITRSCAGLLDHGENGALLLVHLWNRRREDLLM